jgi:hypothetical protein
MKRFILSGVLFGVFGLAVSGAMAAEKPAQFWNLTSKTVVSLRLAHAGAEYGDNLAAADPDGVDHDERLIIGDLPSGVYNVELGFKGGRVCTVFRVEIVTGKVFSVEDSALKFCTKR